MTQLNNLQNSTQAASALKPKSSALTVSTQELDESFFAHIAGGYWQWRALYERDPQARIEQQPDYVLTELRYEQRNDARPGFVIFAQQGDQTVGAAVLVPKAHGNSARFGPSWKLRGYRLVGNQMLSSTDEAVRAALLQEARTVLAQTRADFLMLEDVEEQSPLRQAVLGGAGGWRTFQPAASQSHHRIEFSGGADDYWKKFSSKTRNTLRRKVKQFDGGRLERVTQPMQVADYLAHAHEISKQSWQSELLGLRVRNDDRELEMLTRLATEGALRSYVLWKDDVPVSFCFGTQHNGVFMYEEVAYDRRWSESSPGQVLVIQMLDDLLEHDSPRVFDFGFGDAEYKRQFGNAVTHSGPLWLLRPGLKSALIVGYINGRRSAVQGLRSVLVKTGMLQWVKQRVKGLRGKKE